MRILATLEEPTEGTATVDGVSLIEEPEVGHRLIGYVPDSLPSHRDITVHEYLDFFARAYGVRGEKRRRTVEGGKGPAAHRVAGPFRRKQQHSFRRMTGRFSGRSFRRCHKRGEGE